MKPTASWRTSIVVAALCLLMVLAAGCLVPDTEWAVTSWSSKSTQKGQNSGRRSSIPGATIPRRAWSRRQTAVPHRGEVCPGVGIDHTGLQLDGNGSFVWNATGRGAPISSVAETTGASS